MTYSGDSPILGRGTVSAEAITAWFNDLGPAYAPKYAPDKQFQRVPLALGQALVAECARYPEFPLNHDLVAGQVLHETAAWQSRYARERNNPGGIGAINSNPDLALTFPSIRAGVQAHVAHLLVYAVGDGPWSAADPRRDNVADADWLGVAHVWRDLNGRWAYPGTSYGQRIAALANDLTDYAEHGVWGKDDPVAPPIIRRILPWDASNRPQALLTGGSWDWLTVHNTGNTNPGATARMHGQYLLNLAAAGKGEPSWHYTVDDTEIVQHMEDDWAGWHASDGNGPGNFDSLGIELVEVGDQDKVLRNAAWLIAQKLHQRGVGLDRVRQHHDWARDKKNCPRLLRAGSGAGWQRLQLLVQAELDRLRQPQPEPEPDPDEIPAPPKSQPDPWGTQWWIASHFVDYIRRHDWMEFGYAVSEAFAERGADGRWRIVQYFERARLELNEGGEITRGLVGRESLLCRYPERRP